MKIVEKTAKYILSKGHQYFEGWTVEAVEDYVIHHLNHKSIAIAMSKANEVIGVMVGWRQFGHEHIKWRWQDPEPHGDVFWWDQYIADSPEVAALLAVEFCEKRQDIVNLPASAYRNGRLRKYKPGYMFKIWKRAEALYGHKN